MNIVFVTGNEKKAKYFSELIGLPIEHQKVGVHEIQSLDLNKIVEHKAKEAFEQIKRPVIVEDASVAIVSMGRLPGPLIKWFVDEIGLEKICRLADLDKNRSAIASDTFAYYDGKRLELFQGQLEGAIADTPKGDGGYDWDKIFIPQTSDQTLAEMNPQEYEKEHLKIKPIQQVRNFLLTLDNR